MNTIAPKLRQAVKEQFGRPQGWLGRLVGHLMAHQNAPRNRLSVDLLNVQPEDRILEIGFGPGVAISLIAQQLDHGHVSGIDHSSTMLRQAARRNQAGLRSGTVSLHHAPANALPFEAERFTKVFAENVFHHWQDPEESLVEARRVLGPEGLFLLVEEPHGARRKRGLEALKADFRAALQVAEFQGIRTEMHRFDNRPVLAVFASR